MIDYGMTEVRPKLGFFENLLHDGSSCYSIHEAARKSCSTCLKKYINTYNKTGVNQRDHNGFTPLHYAAREGSPEVVSLLLAAGANIEAPVMPPIRYIAPPISNKELNKFVRGYPNQSISTIPITNAREVQSIAVMGEPSNLSIPDIPYSSDGRVTDGYATYTPICMAIVGRNTKTLTLLLLSGARHCVGFNNFGWKCANCHEWIREYERIISNLQRGWLE